MTQQSLNTTHKPYKFDPPSVFCLQFRDVLSIYSISILKFSSKLSFYQDICDYKLTFFLRRKAPLANLSCFDLVNNCTRYKTWSSTVLKPVFVWPEFWTRRTIFHCLSSQAEKRQSKATIFNI